MDDNMNKGADWMSWSLHFILGLVVGAIGSIGFMRDGRRSIPLISAETAPSFILGAALIGAALGSQYGDRLWVGLSYRVIPPDEPRQSAASRRASLVVGSIGAAFVLVALARSFGLLR